MRPQIEVGKCATYLRYSFQTPCLATIIYGSHVFVLESCSRRGGSLVSGVEKLSKVC
jgi:hypothetical protein